MLTSLGFLSLLAGSAWAQSGGWGGSQGDGSTSSEAPAPAGDEDQDEDTPPPGSDTPRPGADTPPPGSDTPPPAAAPLEPPPLSVEEVAPGELEPPTLLDFPELGWPNGYTPYTPQTVELLILVDEAGKVEDVSLVEGQAPFSDMALDAAPDLRFTPAYDDVGPLAVEIPFSWNFVPPPENVVGVLKVAGSRAPAQRVTVVLGDLTLETDDAGGFSVRAMPPGDYALTIADPTLSMDPITVTVVDGEILEIEAFARAQGRDDEIVGTYTRQRAEVISRAMSAEELRTTPGTMGDPVRAVTNLPGVVKTPFDSGWLLVRGGDPEDTGVYIDGVRVPLIYHLGGFTSVVHPAMVDNIVFMPGGYGVRYGRAISGAVDLRTVDAKAERRVEIGADLVHAGVYAQTPLGEDSAIAMAVRRSYIDKVLARVLSEEQARIAPRFYDWQLKYNNNRMGLMWLGYSDTVDAPTGYGDETVEVNILTNRVFGHLDFETGLGVIRVQPVASIDRRTYDFTDDVDERDIDTFALRAELIDDGTERVGLQVGVDTEFSAYRIQINDIEEIAPLASTDPYFHVRVGETQNIVLGARLDTLFVQGHLPRVGVSPRAQINYPVNRKLALVTDAGLYHQPPPYEWMIGLPVGKYIDLERSYGQGLGVRLKGAKVSYDVDAYWRRMEKLMVFEDDGSLGEGQGFAYGLENLFRWTAGDFGGWVAYTYSRSLRRLEPGDPLDPHTYDQPHYVVNVVSWALPKGWTLAARNRYGTGYPRQRDAEEAYDLLQLDDPEVPLDTREVRLQDYHSMDIKISKAATFRSWQLEYYLDFQNIYNRRIAEPLITGIDDRQTVYAYGLTTLPIFGVKGVFWPLAERGPGTR